MVHLGESSLNYFQDKLVLHLLILVIWLCACLLICESDFQSLF